MTTSLTSKLLFFCIVMYYFIRIWKQFVHKCNKAVLKKTHLFNECMKTNDDVNIHNDKIIETSRNWKKTSMVEINN